jgi:hypothetical protein
MGGWRVGGPHVLALSGSLRQKVWEKVWARRASGRGREGLRGREGGVEGGGEKCSDPKTTERERRSDVGRRRRTVEEVEAVMAGLDFPLARTDYPVPRPNPIRVRPPPPPPAPRSAPAK